MYTAYTVTHVTRSTLYYCEILKVILINRKHKLQTIVHLESKEAQLLLQLVQFDNIFLTISNQRI